MTSTRLWSGPDTTSFKSNSELRRRPLPAHTDFRHAIGSVGAEEEFRRSQWPAWRRRRVLGVRVAGAKTRECSLSQLAAMRTRQLHLPRGPVLPAPQFALQGTGLATGRDQIIRDAHYCGILEQSGPAVTRDGRCASICP